MIQRIIKVIVFAVLIFFISVENLFAQDMFDDFNYMGSTDTALVRINRWVVVDGLNGPPAGANYSKENITFFADPDLGGNMLMGVSTTALNTLANSTHGRIETNEMPYRNGTFAARVYLDDTPTQFGDGNVETFYTIGSYATCQQPDLYSECDFEYLPYDVWGGQNRANAMYTTTWETCNQNVSTPLKRSYAGWHTLIFTCAEGQPVQYYIDGVLVSTHNQHQPDANVNISFANWIAENTVGTSPTLRKTTMKVDWVYHAMNTVLNAQQVETLVNGFRRQGIIRKNIHGERRFGQPLVTGVATFYKDCNYGGYAVNLAEGNYTTGQLQAKGISNNDISSLKVRPGYTVTLYNLDNFGGSSVVKTGEVACLVADGFNDVVSALRITKASTAFTKTIEAEHYTQMGGVQTEETTDPGGGLNVGYIDAGDWMAYSGIMVPVSGYYTVEYRVASPSGSQLSLDLQAGTIELGVVNIPATGGWQLWTTVSHTVYIDAGVYDFGIYAPASGWNINWWRITQNNASSGVTLVGGDGGRQEPFVVYPNPAAERIQLKGFSGSDDIDRVTIYSNSGNPVLSWGKQEANEISIHEIGDLPRGIYLIKVQAGKRQHTIPLVKQ